MNIEKNKPFLLKIPNFEENFDAIFTTKDNKDFILVTLNDKRIFKICLNEKNESEYYQDEIIINKEDIKNIRNFLENNDINYLSKNFNFNDFFIEHKPLNLHRNEIQYSLSIEEPNDYLIKNKTISKILEIKSSYFSSITSVFIFRYENKISYSLLVDAEKIVKFEFEIINQRLNLIKEEHYNKYININFLILLKEFDNLISTSHEMQRDIQSSNKFFTKMYEELFIIWIIKFSIYNIIWKILF